MALNRIEPLRLSNLDELEELFGNKGGCGGCWCMNYRCEKKEFEKGKGEVNRDRLFEKVKNEIPTGLIAYEAEVPIGWISIAPRTEFPRMLKSRIMQTGFTGTGWCITCLYVKPECRGRKVSDWLVQAACEFAFQQGADCVEAFPSVTGDKKLPAPFVWKGLPGMYLRNGFEVIRKASNSQWVVRKVKENTGSL